MEKGGDMSPPFLSNRKFLLFDKKRSAKDAH